MKTPKRKTIPGLMPEDWMFDPPHYASNQLTRWKRKNRIAQLKRSLRKYKEGTMLPKLMHIRYAYKWIQELKKPNQNAEVICWHTYLAELKTIRDSINRAVEDAAICLGEAIERENRKEQE